MTPETPARRGRPQDDGLTEEILAETRLQLELHGYPDLRIERIAAAVGCGKSAIYRRWPNRGALVAASMNEIGNVGTVPDTGSVVEDLVVHVQRNVDNYAVSSTETVFSALVAPDVRELLWKDGFLARRRRMGHRVIQRGIDRGELPPDTDADAVLDVLAGFVFYRRTVRVAPIEPHEVRSIVIALVGEPLRRPAEIAS